MTEMPRRPARLTQTQMELFRLLASGAAVAVIRRQGAKQSCRLVPNLIDYRWRKRHKGRPVQEHTLAGLVRRGWFVRTAADGWIVWRIPDGVGHP